MPAFERIEAQYQQFIEAQKIFFVATAAPDGKVNLSPKGMESLRVMGPNRIVWLNLTGAENETAAHLAESPRMTIMWCSFTEKPIILRVYGNTRIIHPRDDGWNEVATNFPPIPGSRQILDLDVNFVLKSCGFGVPRFGFVGERESLRKWAETKGEEGLARVWSEKNHLSIDGKPTGIIG